MLLAVAQIVLRVFFSFGFVWADELVKLFVLWIALIASIAASRNNRHLRIDVLSHFVAEKYSRLPRIVVDTFAAFMCGLETLRKTFMRIMCAKTTGPNHLMWPELASNCIRHVVPKG